ncbi:helix-hairpin-helix domain-containing protein [Chitinophaga sp. XS-30]|uniref:ComEA family DNA-binding protein n=1 Tax=Chitinophaga sp. XS-30 TaxID=2604421 RepID=UPI0011DCAA87|nr:helix-hairpin-helix domain-containing protein [Chitinophaga sp. XS-30]QEH40607.1 helix-hairpin-helix domain-containing protein [Chitinophaga sp. XS-30]
MPKNFLTDYCSFSRRERTGIAVLLGLITLLCFLPDAWEHWRKEEPPLDTAGFHHTAMLLETALAAAPEAPRYPERYPRKAQYTTYRKKSPYRKDSAYRQFTRPVFERPKPPSAVDINTADTLLLDRLPGIGPVLARRIVLFRERLGGFFSIAQVAETYGLADSVFVKIQPLLQLGNVSLRKIDLNETDEKSLADHPYIDTKLARTIIRYRNSHGPFRSVEGLKAIALVDEVIYRKLENYLVVK